MLKCILVAAGFAAGSLAVPVSGLTAQDEPPQQRQAVTCHEIAGASATLFAVTFLHGFDDDAETECGAARVLVECRLERARNVLAVLKTARRDSSGMHVAGDLSVVFVQVDRDGWQRGVAFVRALFDHTPLSDDAIRLVVAKAALVADKSEWLYPGSVLQSKARMALLSDRRARAVQGAAAGVQKLAPERVRALLSEPVTVEITAFGAVPFELRSMEFSVPHRTARVLAALGHPTSATARVASREPDIATHARTDYPFAAVAFAVPEHQQGPALALGIEVARSRAARQFRRLAEQTRARAPAVAWSWLDRDPVVVLCRRGYRGDAVEVAFGELERFTADLLDRPPSQGELESARRSLLGELSPLPWSEELTAALGRSPVGLPGRAMAAVRSSHRGVTASAIAGVTAAMAHKALRATLRPGRSWRGGLIPEVGPGQSRRR